MNNELASGKDICALGVAVVMILCIYIYSVAEHLYGN